MRCKFGCTLSIAIGYSCSPNTIRPDSRRADTPGPRNSKGSRCSIGHSRSLVEYKSLHKLTASRIALLIPRNYRFFVRLAALRKCSLDKLQASNIWGFFATPEQRLSGITGTIATSLRPLHKAASAVNARVAYKISRMLPKSMNPNALLGV